MKKDKEIKLYEEPVIKVVKFTIEHGFAGSEYATGEDPVVDPGEPDDPDASPQGSSSGFFSVNSGKNDLFSHSF